MSDIELLLMPQHLLRQRLMVLDDTSRNHIGIESWLRLYLTEKYNLPVMENDTISEDLMLGRKKIPLFE